MELTFVESKGIIAMNKRLQPFKEETDLIGVRKLIHKTIEACYYACYDEPVVEYLKEFHNYDNIRERAKNGYTLVYLIDGKIVGSGSLTGYRINDLFVDPALHGKGIGKRIMYSLFCEAEKQNIKSLQLIATPVSVSFFKHIGFQYISDEEILIENMYPLYFSHMKKKLP